MKWLYKYPQAAFPYTQLCEENRRRDRRQPEYELLDTGVFEGDRYFDVVVEYAKASSDDILIRFTITNRGPDAARLHLLPTLWFRNTWSWDRGAPRPRLREGASRPGWRAIEAEHLSLGRRWLSVEGAAELLFTENDTNKQRLWGVAELVGVREGRLQRLRRRRPAGCGQPGAGGDEGCGPLSSAPGAPARATTVSLRLSDAPPSRDPFGKAFDAIVAERIREADEFYAALRADGRLRGRSAGDAAGRSPACCGASSSTSWTSSAGWPAILPSRRRPRRACPVATASGGTSTTKTSSRCPTSGSTRGTPPGTWRSTASRWR